MRKTMIKENKYYIGIRNSDVAYSCGYFSGSFTMFTEKIGAEFLIRPNQNKDVKEFLPFVKKEMENIDNQKQNAKFMFYNGLTAYRLPQNLHRNFICLNDETILNFLNDKISCKAWFINNAIPVLEHETVLGMEIIETTAENLFTNTKKFVLQDNHGGGGIGTYLVSAESLSSVKTRLIPLKKYIMSPYLGNSISVNAHVFISDKQAVLSPASVQLIEIRDNQLCYRGADFFAFEAVPSVCKTAVKKLSLKIANMLRTLGYRGVAGIDFIISEKQEVFCSEINPRFQASSILLDLYLSDKSKTKDKMARSVYELNEQAFANNLKSNLCFEDKINYSCYYYYKDEMHEKYFKMKAEQLKRENVAVHLDGLKFDEKISFDNDSYMFRAVFTHPISAISPDNSLWINDNVTINEKPKDIFDLKIALLNQGIRLVNVDENIKKGVYESIDISFRGEEYGSEPTDMNCAFGINLSQYSPFELDCRSNRLYYYDELLGTAQAELDLLSGLTENDKKILYLATDRLRIKLVSGCEFKNLGKGCAFCNVPESGKRFELNEIVDALEKIKKIKPTFRHILIGGGTCLDTGVWDKIVQMVKYLKNDEFYQDKPISLMTVLPPKNKLKTLKEAGIAEVAFNLEIVDEQLAKQYMKGKHSDKKYFYQIMEEAVKVFGAKNVRSALIVGFDKSEDLINEVETMAKKGILPCLSAFRTLPRSELQLMIPPTNFYLRNIFEQCDSAIKNLEYTVCELGPLCKRCRNNMLII